MSEEMIVDFGGGRSRSMTVEYPGNSNKAKEQSEKPEVKPVVLQPVTRRKKSLLDRISGSVVNEDTQTVGQYILFDVMIPAAKNMISDAVSQGIERMLFGEVRSRSSSQTRPGYTSYNRISRAAPAQQYERRELGRQQRARHDFDDIVLASRGEAEDVLDGLRDLVDKFSQATVADLYDLVGISGEFTDHKWGWFELKNAGVRSVRGGYMVLLPKPEPID
jgi:hypothetical protein